MKLINIILYVFLSVVALLTGFFIWALVTEYRPKTVELIYENHIVQEVADEFVITIWNIGYAGMNAEMDFFMDGGRQTRTIKEQTQINMRHIVATLDTLSSDFFLLQEVDERAKRSYRINEFEQIASVMPDYYLSKAYNFKTEFVPVPLFNPIGKVRSGLAAFSKTTPVKVERYAFPNATPLPNRLFDLKRCFIVSEYKAQNNKSLYIINTHNSAFDSGEGRKKEIKYLRETLENLFRQDAYVVVGGDWNQLPPDYPAEPSTPQYTPHRIPQDLLPYGWQVIYDQSVETVRFANEPYVRGRTLTATVDFFLVSPNIEVLKVKCHDLEFRNSDHNPVQARFRLR
jgi:endonuclease/exonuclease/phosphatase family metal-dependent hydrolase